VAMIVEIAGGGERVTGVVMSVEVVDDGMTGATGDVEVSLLERIP